MTVKLCVVITGLTLLIGGVTATGRFMPLFSAHVSSAAVSPTTIEPIPTVQASDEAPSDIQVVLLTVRSEGFEPAEMNLRAGEYLLVVRNRTGLESVDVRLTRENGEYLGQAKVGARHKDWKQRLKLTPGTYLLRATNRSDWTWRIVVDK